MSHASELMVLVTDGKNLIFDCHLLKIECFLSLSCTGHTPNDQQQSCDSIWAAFLLLAFETFDKTSTDDFLID